MKPYDNGKKPFPGFKMGYRNFVEFSLNRSKGRYGNAMSVGIHTKVIDLWKNLPTPL